MLMEEKIKKLFSEKEQEQLVAEKNTVSFTNLIFEVTRRCQLKCAHCLRGEAQNIDMSEKTLVRVINMAKNISSVTFTGGEPTLNMEIIELCYALLHEKFKRSLPSFFIATNGYGDQIRLAKTLIPWYAESDEPEFCNVCISQDIFHGKFNQTNYLQGLKFYTEDKMHEMSEEIKDVRWVIKEGRGKNLNVQDRLYYSDPAEPFDIEFCDETYWISNDVYVSAKGEVLCGCDFSYETIAANKLCTVRTLASYLKKHFSAMKAAV